jgi:hypothetical protein
MTGSICVLGEDYTTPENAKAQLMTWHRLYLHRILNHGNDLHSNLISTLPSLPQDCKRAIAIDSRQSYAYRSHPGKPKPRWDDICPTYTDTKEDLTCPGAPRNGALCRCMQTAALRLHPKFAIGTRGQILLAPGSAREGDIICHFRNTDVAVIARKTGTGLFYSVLGGAIVLRRWDEEPERVHVRLPDKFRYSTGIRTEEWDLFGDESDAMTFHLDLACVRMLTCRVSDFGAFGWGEDGRAKPTRDHFDGVTGRQEELPLKENNWREEVWSNVVNNN